MMVGQSDWASWTMREVPFWRDDMTPEEYEIERAYWINMFSRGIEDKINYKALWRQGKKVNFDLSQDFMEIVEFAGKIAHMTDDELEKILIDI